MLRAVLFSAPAIILLTALMATASLVCSLWDRKGTVQHRAAQVWSGILLRLGFVRCEVFGIEKLDPKQSFVLVANHASYMDTPAVLSSLPLQIRFFANDSLFSIPFLGWHLSRAGHLPVIHDDPRASIRSMLRGAKLIAEQGVSVLLFPEGGRSGSRLQPFKEGAAYIAIKAGIPVVPIGLVGTRNVLPIHSWIIRPGTVELHVGDPISTTGMRLQDRGLLTRVLEDRVAKLLGENVRSNRSRRVAEVNTLTRSNNDCHNVPDFLHHAAQKRGDR